MVGHIVDFVAKGEPRALSRAIEEHARGRGAVSVLVVPWESDRSTLRMAVTLVEADGWAIAHTNLGTVILTDLGGERVRVVVAADTHDADHPDRERFLPLLDVLGRQIQSRFQAEGGPGQVS